MPNLAGLVLAAGAGTRRGGPKALERTANGDPWLSRAVSLLRAAGCSRIVVVLGARADEAEPLVPAEADVEVVVATSWAEGMSASLRIGLASITDASNTVFPPADAVLLTLVDLPELPASVAKRVVEAPISSTTLRQAVFGGRPGHPVVIGRDHWVPLAATLSGDHGARAYLGAGGAEEIECGDLSTGDDVDS